LFDPTKPVQTRDGRPARILDAAIKNPLYPIAAVYLGDSSTGEPPREIVAIYTKDGFYSEGDTCPCDLVNVPIKKGGWINIYQKNNYPGAVGDVVCRSKEEAIERRIQKTDVTTIYIEWEEA
jgi:hypothetical protein